MLTLEQIENLISNIPPELPEDLYETIKKGFGWISPDGQIFPVSQLNHIQFFEKNFPKFFLESKKTVEAMKAKHERENSLEVAMAEHENYMASLYENGFDDKYYHPEWHTFNFDVELFDVAHELYKIIYSAGWVRVGIIKGESVHVEGSENALRVQSRQIRDIKLATDLKVIKNVVKP